MASSDLGRNGPTFLSCRALAETSLTKKRLNVICWMRTVEAAVSAAESDNEPASRLMPLRVGSSSVRTSVSHRVISLRIISCLRCMSLCQERSAPAWGYSVAGFGDRV